VESSLRVNAACITTVASKKRTGTSTSYISHPFFPTRGTANTMSSNELTTLLSLLPVSFYIIISEVKNPGIYRTIYRTVVDRRPKSQNRIKGRTFRSTLRYSARGIQVHNSQKQKHDPVYLSDVYTCTQKPTLISSGTPDCKRTLSS